ncbi:MAG: hypothetical protein RBS73_13475 [Prolixibacteraceae bacterium]|nr:hypothetical protein [Prolixibacteraceae bacterium]
MEFSNQVRTKKIKRNFNLAVVVFIAIAIYFVWRKEDLIAVYIGIGFVVFLVLMFFLNFNYVSFSTKNGKVVMRYYPVISIFNREYSSIDFQHALLYKYDLKTTFPFREITLTVKTRQGVADYPPVCLNALTKNEINAIREKLEAIFSARMLKG